MTGRSAVILVGRLSAVALAATVSATAARAAEPSASDGEVAFNNHCRTCHSTKPGDNRLGPSLSGIIGRKAGTATGFNYSPAFKTTSVVWDAATLDRFITKPDQVFPGSNMATFAGLDDAGERRKIIDFLTTQK